MAEVTRLVCDRCKAEEGVESYRISTPGTRLHRAMAVDLCKACAAPVEEIAALGRSVSRSDQIAPRRGTGGEGLRAKIYTQEELDNLDG